MADVDDPTELDVDEQGETKNAAAAAALAKDTEELAAFRDQWKKDLESRQSNAVRLYNDAVNFESQGLINEAITAYRRAFKLEPSVEKFLRGNHAVTLPSAAESSLPTVPKSSHVANGTNTTESQPRRRRDAADPVLRALAGQDLTIQPYSDDHILLVKHLPEEVILLIFTFLAESSVSALARVSKVCRLWYVLAQDNEIWKRLCLLAWPDTIQQAGIYNDDWKKMFTDRPRLRYDGIYICKITYLRQGETNSYYQPIHLVTYYRYLRFFPDGTLLSLLSSDEPVDVVHQMKDAKANIKNIMHGQYVCTEHLASAKPYLEVNIHMRSLSGALSRYLYCIMLHLRSTYPGGNNKLSWVEYFSTVDEDVTNNRTLYDLADHKPFFFSKVRSYTDTS